MNFSINYNLATAVMTILWVMGMVLAKGFWSMLFAIFIFPYSWYLSVQHLMKVLGAL